MAKEKFYPIPEALGRKAGAWSIKQVAATPGDPCTNIIDCTMAVPLGDSPLHRIIRAHEMAHAKWSPEQLPDLPIPPQALHVAEEARVNSLLAEAGFDTGLLRSDVDPPAVRRALEMEDVQGLIYQAAAGIGSGRLGDFRKTMQETDEGRKLLKGIENRVIRPGQAIMSGPSLQSFDATVQLAQLLGGLAAIPPDELNPDGDGELTEEFKRQMRAMMAEGEGNYIDWGNMVILNPSLSNSLIGKVGRKNVATDEGCVPRRMDRYCSDGAVFDRIRRWKGGTVLIDVSGSMDLNSQEVESIVMAAPGATVAMYCGEESGEGYLTVIAKDGRIADARDMNPQAKGNVIDGPALDWLGKQSEPRLWVCDGVVTGVGDQLSPRLAIEAEQKCQSGKIKRHSTVDTAIDVLDQLYKRRR